MWEEGKERMTIYKLNPTIYELQFKLSANILPILALG
jgi:hypothetical protein